MKNVIVVADSFTAARLNKHLPDDWQAIVSGQPLPGFTIDLAITAAPMELVWFNDSLLARLAPDGIALSTTEGSSFLRRVIDGDTHGKPATTEQPDVAIAGATQATIDEIFMGFAKMLGAVFNHPTVSVAGLKHNLELLRRAVNEKMKSVDRQRSKYIAFENAMANLLTCFRLVAQEMKDGETIKASVRGDQPATGRGEEAQAIV